MGRTSVPLKSFNRSGSLFEKRREKNRSILNMDRKLSRLNHKVDVLLLFVRKLADGISLDNPRLSRELKSVLNLLID